uniref:V-set immunoregulatory receptor n=1 Tax=Amphilophus citrinellus TaxID=61819 RepID=A0A3Q0R5Y6_AMPCI
MHHSHSTMVASAPHQYYTCSEGATAKMVCTQKGTLLNPSDAVKSTWLFTSHSDQHCVPGKGPRNYSHLNRTLPPGVQFRLSENDHWLTLQNVRASDQGRYCCVILEVKVDHKHGHIVQKSYNHVILHVIPRKCAKCLGVLSVASPGSVPVALAITACIVALLSLPLILVLVYKQRENSPSRRRIETQGHENPVFLGGSPETKTRTVSQIMTRQSSETGRHLLSEPGTPFSPPAHGDVFFPAEDAIPESPEFQQV